MRLEEWQEHVQGAFLSPMVADILQDWAENQGALMAALERQEKQLQHRQRQLEAIRALVEDPTEVAAPASPEPPRTERAGRKQSNNALQIMV